MAFRRRCLDRYVYCIAGLCTFLLFFAIFNKNFTEHFGLSSREHHGKLPYRPINYLLKPNDKFCEQLNFLVVVHVRYNDQETRDFWRSTYGTAQFLRKYRYRILFAIGLGFKAKDRNRALYFLEDEHHWHGDLLLGDYDDTYKNISIKQLSHLKYFSENCRPPTILVKIDDDIGWRWDMVAWMARDLKMNATDDGTAKIRCLLWRNMTIGRDPKMKWYVPESIFPGDVYPEYCSGIAYFATWQAVSQIVHVSKEVPYFWVDDVYITGMIASRANVSREAMGYYQMLYDGGLGLEQGYVMFQMGPRYKRNEMFNRALNGIGQYQPRPFPYFSYLLDEIYPTGEKPFKINFRTKKNTNI